MTQLEKSSACPACGTALSQEQGSEGLCLGCLMELALESPSLMAEIDSPHEVPTLAISAQALSPGQILGDRFRIRALLGRGGMGEVWRAIDLKLRVDVALKALRAEMLSDQKALETLRQEVRMAREVISPNVCRVFDLVELDGKELVSMEYIDGITLLDILKMRAPLDLAEAREIAAQFLAGLEAIHEAGLVHRDIKPENLMMTRSGRVVLMDFGIAKGLTEGGTGTVSGTPAYMAPEQSRGDAPDARADVFSAGVVLAEMIAPGGLASFEARQAIWQGIRQDQPKIPDSPWAPVISKSVARIPEQRYPSASALARALEEVALRVERAEDVHPYPGLSSFSQDDARYFFGRELEVEEMWKQLRRPQLYGLIGPSGAGKSSFLRAGLLPVIPTGWRAVIVVPGAQPFLALARALAIELAGDETAVQDLLQFEDPNVAISVVSKWRQQHDQVLIVLDQFEELFTQNPAEQQAAFAELLGRLPVEADTHVLLAMRDDFIFYCSSQPALSPMFSELTPLRAPSGTALHRALVQPALKCGYRFEDDSLIDEMVAEIDQERGALPLLAFAAARLWEHRDRDQGLLTRQAYEHIGGVGGALAQHAEKTLERIGQDNVPVVRELFRNLVTAEGTRAARTRDELLSVFERGHGPAEAAGHVPTANNVLDTLIDARLLTSYEVPGEDDDSPQQRVEIIHESLLSNWPRLVRWQMQDQDGALLRDQLRQSAQMWEERGKPEDLLWTGTSYNEYELWRERYSGGLSTAEESFAGAMKSHAERRKRRRRLAIAAVITLLVIGLGIVGTFWRQAAVARDQARIEKLRAEANQLLALGRLEIEENRLGAFAYALASLERMDSQVARLLALEILWSGPTAFILDREAAEGGLDFSPNGKWLAVGHRDGDLKLWSSTGGKPRQLASQDGPLRGIRFGSDSKTMVSLDHQNEIAQIWSIPDGEVIRSISLGSASDIHLSRGKNRLFSFTEQGDRTRIQNWPLGGGEGKLLADLDLGFSGWYERNFSWGLDTDPNGSLLAYIPMRFSARQEPGLEVYVLPVDDLAAAPRLVGDHPETVLRVRFHPDERQLATGDVSGVVRFWDLAADTQGPRRILHQPPGYVNSLTFNTTGSRLAATSSDSHVALWDLEGPPDAEPTLLPTVPGHKIAAFSPGGDWLAMAGGAGAKAWPIGRPYPIALAGHEDRASELIFLPDGESIASVSWDGTVRLWPLSSVESDSGRVLFDIGGDFLGQVTVDPSGKQLLIGSHSGQIWRVPLAGGAPRELAVFDTGPETLALGDDLAAAIGEHGKKRVLRVWNLASGEFRDLDPGEAFGLMISSGNELISVTNDGIGRWNLTERTFEIFAEFPTPLDENLEYIDVRPDGRMMLLGGWGDEGEAVLFDLEAGTSLQLDAHGPGRCGTLDPAGRFVVTTPCGGPGYPLIGPAGPGPVHMLVTQESVGHFAFSPDGKWMASAGEGNEIHLWPIPDLSTPPLHTVPLDELLAKLRALTNLRIVPDPESETGWRFDLDPFPGWEEVPTW